jgi:hypothetical protein
LFDVGAGRRTPPPAFTEIAGVNEVSVSDAPKDEDPVTQDEEPTVLTDEQKAAEEKRRAFLMTQVKELQDERDRLQAVLTAKGKSSNATMKSKLEETEKTLSAVRARITKTIFSKSPENPPKPEIDVVGKAPVEAQSTVVAAMINMLSERDDAGPMAIQVVVARGQAPKKAAKETKNAIVTFSKQNQFFSRSEAATPGIVNITF